MKKNQKTKKEKIRIILLIIIATLLLLTISVSFAYFLGSASSDAKTDITVNTDSLSNLVFENGTPISIQAGLENFSENAGNLSSSTITTATLSGAGNYTDYYNVYFEIKYNDFEHCVDENTPELVLQIIGPSGEIKNIEGLDPVTTNGVSGFDITDNYGVYQLATDVAITMTNGQTKIDEWTFILYFINLDVNQNANSGKSFSTEVVLTLSEKSGSSSDSSLDNSNGNSDNSNGNSDNSNGNSDNSNGNSDNSNNNSSTGVLLSDQILMDEDGFSNVEAAKASITLKSENVNLNGDETTDTGLYLTLDNDGTSYYFRGDIDNNYVSFAGYMWKIIRIDGYGNIKMMLYGDGDGIGLNRYTYNNVSEEYMIYENTIIKEAVDTWYKDNLESHSSYIATTKYCVDINKIYEDEEGNILYESSAKYEKYHMSPNDFDIYPISWLSSYDSFYDMPDPSLMCNEENTYNYNIGLMSLDEYLYSGYLTASNDEIAFLYGNSNWTITPMLYYINDKSAEIFHVYINEYGNGYHYSMYSSVNSEERGAFPTISLNNSVEHSTGNGTYSDPYIIALN